MMRFRKRPVVIEAIQWLGNNSAEVEAFVGSKQIWETWEQYEDADKICLPTLEGNMTVSVGDWIIKGTAGEFYPCKPDIFAAVYDEVQDEQSMV